jgi:glucose-6-phosphate 1-epimerase
LETKVVAKEESLFEIRRDNFKDTVVWNPAKEGAEAMGDFEPKTGWQHMVTLCQP